MKVVRFEELWASARGFDADASLHIDRPAGESDGCCGVSALTEDSPNTMTWIAPQRIESAFAQSDDGRLYVIGRSARPEYLERFPNRLLVDDAKRRFFQVATAHFADTSGPAWRAPSVDERKRSPGIDETVRIGNGVSIGNDVVIGPYSCIQYCVIQDRVRIGCNCSIGGTGFGFVLEERDESWQRLYHFGRVELLANVEIGSSVCIDRGTLGATVLEAGVKVDNLVHIAHNVRVGSGSVVIAHAMLGGSASIGQKTWIAPGAMVRNQITVGPGSTVGMGAVVVKHVDPSVTVAGNPARKIEPR